MSLSGGRFPPVQLDARRDLIRVSGSIAQRSIHLRASEHRVLNKRRNSISLGCQILHPHDDLPHIGATQQPSTPTSRAITEGDQRMFIAASALLGITAEAIRESLTSSTCPQTKPIRKRIVEPYRDVY
jgi:hypothetical protein